MLKRIELKDKEKVKFPKLVPCDQHEDYNKECQKCKKLNRARKNKVIDATNGKIYQTIYDNYHSFYEHELNIIFKNHPKFDHSKSESKALVNERTCELLTKNLYPFTDDSPKTVLKMWNDALLRLQPKMQETFIPMLKKSKRNYEEKPLW